MKEGRIRFFEYSRSLFLSINVIAVYFLILPSASVTISVLCRKQWSCRKFLVFSKLGYYFDSADRQYIEYRSNILNFIGVCVALSIFRLVLNTLARIKPQRSFISVSHIQFHFGAGMILLIYLHAYQSLVILVLTVALFSSIKKLRGSSICPLVIWLYAAVILLLKESHRFFENGYIPETKLTHQIFVILFHHSYGGSYRWRLAANFLVLRLISFSMDWHWATKEQFVVKVFPVSVTSNFAVEPDTDIAAPEADKLLSEESRVQSSLPMEDYNLLHLLAYVTYCPLYIGGPIITFNAFVSYSKFPEPISNSYIITYAGRWMAAFACLELMLHFCPVFATVDSGLFGSLSPGLLAASSYLLVLMMWLKFLVIWRLARLWALVDGIPVPENMTRCVSNNISLVQFWRGWHASYNRWILRYLYQPLGGRTSVTRNTMIVFLFVAFWHDAELKLLLWGALNCVFYVAETVGRRAHETPWFRSLPPLVRSMMSAIAAASNITVLVGVNLLGYAIGVSGTRQVVERFWSWEGVHALVCTFYILCVGYFIMNDIDKLRSKYKY